MLDDKEMESQPPRTFRDHDAKRGKLIQHIHKACLAFLHIATHDWITHTLAVVIAQPSELLRALLYVYSLRYVWSVATCMYILVECHWHGAQVVL